MTDNITSATELQLCRFCGGEVKFDQCACTRIRAEQTKSVPAKPTSPIDQDWAANCAAQAEGYEKGLQAAARIVDAYGKAAHGQLLKDMAPIISKSITRLLEVKE